MGYAIYKRDISAFKILVIIPERREHLEDIASGGRIISKWTLEKLVMRAWICVAEDVVHLQTLVNA